VADFESFDIHAYLDSKGIEYHTSGKNVSTGWINIQCLFCADQSNHLGINLNSKSFHCWKCSEAGSLFELVQEIESSTPHQTLQIIDRFQEIPDPDAHRPIDLSKVEQTKLPKQIVERWPKMHLRYLERRRYDPQTLIEKYQLKPVHNVGRYAWRIIVPFYQDGYLVTYSAIDVTGQAEIRYKNCPNDESMVPVKDTLYNIDSVEGSAIIVEGLFDCWRMGEGACALMGSAFTERQINLLVRKEVCKAIILLDSDATEQTERLGNTLDAHGMNVMAVRLKKGDPDDLAPEEVAYIRSFL